MADLNNPAPPPPAPPLPPPKYGNRATNAIVRFAQPFIYGSRPPTSSQASQTSQTSRPDGGVKAGPRTSYARSPVPLSSQMTTHKTGIPIDALDISPQRTHVILAGREILKTVRVAGTNCTEEFNLRSAIIAYASTHNQGGTNASIRNKEQLAAKDVKWSHGRFETFIATAAANGHIIVYDLTRAGVASAHFHEHSRPVHKLAFNPHEGAYLLSASQDGTVKLWDLRNRASDHGVMTCRSKNTYMGNSECIRDVKWSPEDGVEFAFCTDTGSVQKWDTRKCNAPLLKINAHEKPCLSIDWHHDGKHLLSAGGDKHVKVWNFSSSDRRMKPTWDLHTPQIVTNARWRPLLWSNEQQDSQNPGSWQSTFIATSYDHKDPRIHVWDFKRPHIPVYEYDRYNHSPADLLWCSEDLLWTVGPEGIFTQIDMNFSTRILERRSFCSLDWGSDGELVFFTQKRPTIRSVTLGGDTSSGSYEPQRLQSGSEKTSDSHSMTDEVPDESMLSTSWQKRLNSKSSSAKSSSKSLSSTPPSVPQSKLTIGLSEAMEKVSQSIPTQIGARGHVYGATFDLDSFKYLAKAYSLLPKTKSLSDALNLPQKLLEACQENARHAKYVGMYRLSQTWMIVGLALHDELLQRIIPKELQETKSITAPADNAESTQEPQAQLVDYQNKIPATENIVIPAGPVSDLNASLHAESTSNMTTPTARPVSDKAPGDQLPDLPPDQDKHLDLPPAAFKQDEFAKSAPSGGPVREIALNEEPSLLDHANFSRSWRPNREEGIEDPRAAIRDYKATERPPLSYDLPSMHPGLMGRHDSNESFQMFSVSAGSSRRDKSLSGSLAESQDSINLNSSPDLDGWETDGSPLTNRYPRPSLSSNDSFASGVGDGLSGDSLQDNYQELSRSALSSREREPPDHHLLPARIKPMQPLIEYEEQSFAPMTVPQAYNSVNTDLSDHNIDLDDSLYEGDSYIPPWTASKIIPRLVNYHLEDLFDFQFPAQILLYLQSNLNQKNRIIPFHLVKAIFTAYHEQLFRNLPMKAVEFRKSLHHSYSSVYDFARENVTIKPYCQECHKPFEFASPSQSDLLVCDRCKGVQAMCPVCWSRDPPSSIVSLADNKQKEEGALWSWCQGCGHGGHVVCMRYWFSDTEISEGGCATQGCFHDCCIGKRKKERKLRREKETKRRKGLAKRDSWVANESRAVEKTRGVLAANGGTTNLLSGSGSGGKRVRLVIPDDEDLTEEQNKGGYGERRGSSRSRY
ncbi:MAG: SEA (Seh1-associated) complex subunit [Cirrosporium novae-zelandiae]|nr:MAG: SEA (Seh1-associated) complex subunit [Cirrosporium novae-zelandiae]